MTEQDKFEAWIKPTGLALSRRPNGAYVDLQADAMWESWQAAIASCDPMIGIDTEALKRGQEKASKAWAGLM